jgi:hypothetical protein
VVAALPRFARVERHELGRRRFAAREPAAGCAISGSAERRRATRSFAIASRQDRQRWRARERLSRGGYDRQSRIRRDKGRRSRTLASMIGSVLFDAAGRRRSPATTPGFHCGRPPRNKGLRYPPTRRQSRRSSAVMRVAEPRRADAACQRRVALAVVAQAGARGPNQPQGAQRFGRRCRRMPERLPGGRGRL